MANIFKLHDIEEKQMENLPEIIKNYADDSKLLENSSNNWLNALRLTGLEQFKSAGLPDKSWENWKFTNLASLPNYDYLPANSNVSDANNTRLLENSIKIELVDGVFKSCADFDISGLKIVSLKSELENDPKWIEEYLVNIGNLGDNPMMALNTAYINDGFVIKTDSGIKVDRPIEIIISSSTGNANYPRNIILLEESSNLVIFERYLGEGEYINNSVTEIIVKDNANLGHYRIQAEDLNAYHVAMTSLTIAKSAKYDGFTLTTGAKLSRNEIYTKMIDADSSCNLNGIYMVQAKQHADTTILVEHFEPNCVSKQNYKGLIDDHAKGVFQGKIKVNRKAQLTDGYQLNNALLLSDNAEINVKPELEIYADDVKCSHGATSGALDETGLFYLTSRGINPTDARKMIIKSFISTVIEDIEFDELKSILSLETDKWLDR